MTYWLLIILSLFIVEYIWPFVSYLFNSLIQQTLKICNRIYCIYIYI